MGRRVQGFGLLTVALMVVAGIWLGQPAPGVAATVCPPTTIDDLAPSEPEPDTTSSGPDVTSTTQPADTTVPEPPPEPPCDTPFVYPMVYPILGAGDWISGFGAPRDGGSRHHLGNDIAAPKLQPVVAVADGTVSYVGGDEGISGVRVHVRHADGWSTLYIHLNNDTASTDDGNGTGLRSDLAEGDPVEAGEIIGWIGDSGNAEETVPHLHFELRDPGGTPVDPAASLEAATNGAGSFAGPFSDADGEGSLGLLLSRGAPVHCDTVAAGACPEDPATAAAVAGWLESLIGEVDLTPEPPPQPSAEEAIDQCASSGNCQEVLGNECEGDGCSEPVITEAEVARALAWDRLRDAYEIHIAWQEFGVPDIQWSTPPPKPPRHPYLLSLSRSFEVLGGSERCLNPPNPERELTRAEAADVVVLYLGWDEVPHCSTNSAKR